MRPAWVTAVCILSTALGKTQTPEPSFVKMSGRPNITYIGLPESGVQLYGATSTEFNDILGARVTQASRRQLEPILPYSVILVNTRSSPLIAVLVRTELGDTFGRSTAGTMMLSTMTLDNLLPPGATMLMTPITGLNIVLRDSPQLSLAEADSGDLAEVVAARSAVYGTKATIRITLDSVVLDTGVVIGPDVAHNMGRMNSWIQAERALLQEVLRQDSSEIRAFVKRVIDTPPLTPEQMNASIDVEAVAHRGRTAQLLVLLTNHFGTEKNFSKAIHSRLGLLIPELRRSEQ